MCLVLIKVTHFFPLQLCVHKHLLAHCWPFIGAYHSEDNLLTFSLQLSIVNSFSSIGISYPPPSIRRFCSAWSSAGFVYAFIVAVSVYVKLFLWYWQTLFYCSLALPLSPTIFLPFFCDDPWSLKRENMHIEIPFETDHSTIFHYLHVGQSNASVSIVIYCKNNFLWWDLEKSLIYGHWNKSLRINLTHVNLTE